ncbi:MAG: AraC family transcriptional regulator, partial [Bacteroidota bacterium]
TGLLVQFLGCKPACLIEVTSMLQTTEHCYVVKSDFKKAMQTRQTAVLSRHNHPITLEMYAIINDIIQCERQGLFKRIFLESKVISLLLLQLEQIDAYSSNPICKGIKKEDVEKMYAVKELIDKNFKQIETLNGLAKRVGTNEYTLKKGFKELFGTSVFQYWKGLRLHTAKSMLREDGLSVQEVSRRIGYKNPQHFTTAFKRQFGVAPSKIAS